MKKSLLVALLAVTLGLGLAACGAKSTSPLGVDCQKTPTDPKCQG